MVYFFAMSVAFTVFHVLEELVGRGGPLWENFGRIAGVRLPNWLGLLTFTFGLWLALTIVSVYAYIGREPFWMSVLFGARACDCVVSHWLLRLIGWSDPNPGIWTTPLYAAEALWLAGICDLEWEGVACGAVPFACVIPGLWVVGRVVPEWRWNQTQGSSHAR